MQALLSHRSGGCLRTPLIACGVVTSRFWPRVSLSASFSSKAVAAVMHRHGGHPAATGSSLTDTPLVASGPRSLIQYPFCHSALIHVQVEWLGNVWQPKCWGRQQGLLYSFKSLLLFLCPNKPIFCFSGGLVQWPGHLSETWNPQSAESR